MKEPYQVIREGFAMGRLGIDLVPRNADPTSSLIKFEADESGDLELNEEEFLIKPFRLLSQAITPYRYFDFTLEGVLKAAVKLFADLTIYANHNSDVNAWKGQTRNPVWDGKNDPNGINALLALDRTIDQNLARGVEIGALRSASVTIWFEYKRSHPDLRYFYDHLGEEVDGEIVRFIVTKITRAAEVSIVWEGEDPYAKALEANAGEDLNNNDQTGGDDMEFGKDFLKALGINEADISSGGTLAIAAIETAVTKKLETLKTENENLAADAEIGRKHLEGLRDKAAKLYRALKGEKFQESFVTNVIEKADLETAQALVDEYQAGMESAVPLSCPKCGEKLSRRSSVEDGQGGNTTNKNIADFKIG